MTVPISINKVIAPGNGSNTVWTFNFPGVSASDIQVIYTDPTGAIFVLSPILYSVFINPPIAPNPTGDGGTVVYPLTGPAIPIGSSLTIIRILPETQLTSFSNQGVIYNDVIEQTFDYVTMLVQQLQELLGRAISVPVSDSAPNPIPGAIQRAGLLLGFDSNGQPIATSVLPAGLVSSAMQPVVNASTLALGQIAFGIDTYLTSQPSLALAQLVHIQPAADFVMTNGYYVSGDKGGGIYSRASGATAGGFQSADGQWWQLNVSEANPYQFGAYGDNSHDDTISLQDWLNYCQINGLPGFFATGNYLISSALVVSNSNGIVINGPAASPGNGAEAKIILGSLTQDGIVFNTTGRVFIRGFGVVSSGVPTSGSAVSFQGARNQSVGGHIERLDLGFGTSSGTVFNGITATGFAAFTITECSITAQNLCMNISNPGDSEIHNNLLSPITANGGGIFITGDPGGTRILSNKFNSGINYLFGISVKVSIGGDGDLFIIGNSIEGINGQTSLINGYGIILDTTGSDTFGNVIIIGNEIACGNTFTYALWINNTANWLRWVNIKGNLLQSGLGIALHGTQDFIIQGNFGPGFAINIDSSCTTGFIEGNIVTGITNTSTSTIIVNNPGYNPVGVSTPTPGASPWTYTPGASPETLYMGATGSLGPVTQGGISMLPAVAGANINVTVNAEPLTPIVITYTGTLVVHRQIH